MGCLSGLNALYDAVNGEEDVWINEAGPRSIGGVHRTRSSLESLFCYDKPIPEEIIDKPIGLSAEEKENGQNIYLIIDFIPSRKASSGGYMVAFAGRKYAARSLPVFVGDNDHIVTSFTLLAFSSTPLYEPFAIPMLLEKLSSSLPTAKVYFLRYLSNCIVKYGTDRMEKHSTTIWPSLKEAIFTATPKEPIFSGLSELDAEKIHENEIAKEAQI